MKLCHFKSHGCSALGDPSPFFCFCSVFSTTQLVVWLPTLKAKRTLLSLPFWSNSIQGVFKNTHTLNESFFDFFCLPRFSAFCSSQCCILIKDSRIANLTHLVGSFFFSTIKACCFIIFRQTSITKPSAWSVDPMLGVLTGAIAAYFQAIAFPFLIQLPDFFYFVFFFKTRFFLDVFFSSYWVLPHLGLKDKALAELIFQLRQFVLFFLAIRIGLLFGFSHWDQVPFFERFEGQRKRYHSNQKPIK